MITTQSTIIAAVYFRLSSDDDRRSESTSITMQRKIVLEYCDQRDITVYDEYVDDGYSGGNFNRPGFKRMCEDIEAGKVNCVITKDLSRFGRNHYMIGYYIYEYFPEKNIRYISVSENIDTDDGECDIMPYLNLNNEFLLKETSRKVKATFKKKYEDGEYIAPTAPIGYIKDPENKNHLIPDPETEGIVRRVFELTAQGVGKSKICRIFESEQVPTPGWISYQRNGKSFANVFKGAPEEKRYQWCVHAIDEILNNEVYIGNSVHYKQVKISYRTKAVRRNPEDKWLIVENTHEPIIDRELWNAVHTNRNTKQRPSKDGTTHIFSGLVKCADCGKTMSLKTKTKNGKEQKTLDCSTYKKYGPSRCSGHHISYNNLYAFVLQRLQFWITAAKEDKDALYAYVSETMEDKDVTEIKQTENRLKAAKKKLEDIDRKIIKLFEDRDKGVISEKNYQMMVKNYEDDQTKLEDDIKEYEKILSAARETESNVNSWIKVISKYKEITELDADILNEFIEKILIHKPEKDENGNRVQKIDICYRFIGRID
ncbi:MAG: DUF4368 domain-containing protein [Clostridia bacterium]|nr:DUF4368 domain-containing protein [Clostridia bacterium]